MISSCRIRADPDRVLARKSLLLPLESGIRSRRWKMLFVVQFTTTPIIIPERYFYPIIKAIEGFGLCSVKNRAEFLESASQPADLFERASWNNLWIGYIHATKENNFLQNIQYENNQLRYEWELERRRIGSQRRNCQVEVISHAN